jgi:hypothetical protein
MEKIKVSSKVKAITKKVASLEDNSDKVIMGLKGLLTGIAYSIIKSEEYGYSHEIRPSHSKKVSEAAIDICSGKTPEDRKWIAGYYFNDAIYRIAAVYDVSLRILTDGKERNNEVLAKAAVKTGVLKDRDIDKLKPIYKDVNKLKHDLEKALPYQKTKSIVPVIKAYEQLCELVEKASRVKKTKKNR